jgi:hypothetical protein
MNAPLRFLAVFCVWTVPALAGPLQQAAINQIVKEVKVVDPAKGARPAALKETIKDDLAVKTGVESRAELLFQDNTLTRLGAETFFSFKAGTRDLSLERGTMLLQVPKGLGGARIRTASVTASITGTTIMMELLPSKSLKVLVLEGSLRLSPNGRFGEAMLLTAGKMVIMKPDAKRIPEPVDVDLRKMVKTSALIDPAAFKGRSKANPAVLPSIGLIQKEIAKQDALMKERGLLPTNLLIAGSGTEVTIASEEKLAALDRGVLLKTETAIQAESTVVQTTARETLTTTRTNLATDLDTSVLLTDARKLTSGGTITGTSTESIGTTGTSTGTTGTSTGTTGTSTGTTGTPTGTTETPTGTTGTPTGTTETPTGTTGTPTGTTGTPTGTTGTPTDPTGTPTGTTGTPSTPTDPPLITVDTSLPALTLTNVKRVNADTVSGGAVIDYSGTAALLLSAPGAGADLEVSGSSVTLSPSAIACIKLDGGDALLNLTQEGGDAGCLAIGTLAAPIAGNITIDAPISATTGANSLTTATGGTGGNVQLVADGNIDIRSSVTVSSSTAGRASKSGGNIGVLAKRGTIKIESTGQLLSLLSAAAPGAGGTIKFVAEQGDIRVDGGRVQADRGNVELLTAGPNASIDLRNAAISGDVVKIGALGANGQLLIGGGTINADTTLKLYGGNSNGQVRFTDNVTLGGASTKIIAAKTVTIDNSKTVTIGGANPARVFADNANFTGSGGNGSTTGKFGGAGANTSAFGSRPAY